MEPVAAAPAEPEEATLTGVLVEGSGEGYALRFEFDRTVLFRTSYEEGSRRLELSLFPVASKGLAARVPPLSFLKQVSEAGTGRRSTLHLSLQGEVQPRLPLPVGEGRVLSIRFQPERDRSGLPPGASVNRLSRKPVAPGLFESRYRYQSAAGEGSDLFVLEVDTASPDVELGLGWGARSLLDKQSTSAMARAHGALAAVNASFFSKGGDPLGLLATRGRVVSLPLMSRGVLGIFDGGRRMLVGNPGYSGRFDTSVGSVTIDGVNQVRKPGKAILYTPEWGETTGTPGGGLEVAVRDHVAVAVSDGNQEIPRDGFVLAVEGGETAERLASLGLGEKVRMVSGLTPPWDRADLAVGGGPILLREGRVRVDWREEGFSRALVTEKHPRTAVGVRPDGLLLLAVVDGRKAGVNTGVDLYEMAEILAELGCQDAMNLDGGGSSTLVRGGAVQNRPSDGGERPVSTVLMVLPGRRSGPVVAGLQDRDESFGRL